MYILATRWAVSWVLWSLSVSITSDCSTSCSLAATSPFNSASSPSRTKAAMLSLAW